MAVHPGPIDPCLLVLQDKHISNKLWDREAPNTKTLEPRIHDIGVTLHARMEPILAKTGLLGVSKMKHVKIDRALITALIERWRPETHTFHFPIGEMTITLEDVAYLFGLPIEEKPVLGTKTKSTAAQINDYLGFPVSDPEAEKKDQTFRGSYIRLPWLREKYNSVEVDEHTSDDTIIKLTRIWILLLFGCVLFPDTSGFGVPCLYLNLILDLDKVKEYSWGTAVLSTLYRNMCKCALGVKNLAGCSLLLVMWSWEHMYIGRPTIIEKKRGDNAWTTIPTSDDEKLPLGVRWSLYRTFENTQTHSVVTYRDQLDRLLDIDAQVIWLPYTGARLGRLPNIFLQSRHMWLRDMPLINVGDVEQYFPSRVLRQFNMKQEIPINVQYNEHMHKSSNQANIYSYSKKYIDEFNRIRNERLDEDNTTVFDRNYHEEFYMPWFRRVAILYMIRNNVAVTRDKMVAYLPTAAQQRRNVELTMNNIRHCNDVWDTIDKTAQKHICEVLKNCREMLINNNAKSELDRIDWLHTEVRTMFDDNARSNPDNVDEGPTEIHIQDQPSQTGPSQVTQVEMGGALDAGRPRRKRCPIDPLSPSPFQQPKTKKPQQRKTKKLSKNR